MKNNFNFLFSPQRQFSWAILDEQETLLEYLCKFDGKMLRTGGGGRLMSEKHIHVCIPQQFPES